MYLFLFIFLFNILYTYNIIVLSIHIYFLIIVKQILRNLIGSIEYNMLAEHSRHP